MDGVSSSVAAAKKMVAASSREVDQDRASSLLLECDSHSQRTLQLASEKGASSWLTCRPLRQFGFSLPKGTFRDALCLRYGWTPPRLPSSCVCGKLFDSTHALSSPTGGYPAIRHNAIRDLTASLLQEVATDVSVEPPLQPLSGERLHLRSAIREDDARLDVGASGVWGSRFERTFYDIRVFNPHVRSNRSSSSSLASVYTKHEQEKRRSYEERVREVEHGTFLPLVFSTTGGCGKAASTFFKRLGHMLADKRKEPFSTTMAWLRTLISFALVRSCGMSLRGHRVPPGHSDPVETASPSVLAVSDCHIR